MRSLSILLFMCFSVGCATSKKTNAKSNPLNGTWVTVKLEMDGALLPKASFENQKLIILDSTYTFIAESVDKGVVQYREVSKMDIYGKEGVNSGKHFTAFYKYAPATSSGETEQLTICYNLKGDSYPESFDTKGKPMYFVAVFKKELQK